MTSPLSEYATGHQGTVPLSTCQRCHGDIVWVVGETYRGMPVHFPVTVTGEGDRKTYGYDHHPWDCR